MRSEIVSQENNIVKIKAEVPEGEFRQSVEEAIAELREKVDIKGFRKGKVPRNILELHLGREAIQSEALEKMLPKTIDTLVEEYELELIDRPKVDIETLEDNEPLVMTFTFETRPEVELGDVTELEVKKRVVDVNDEMVDEAIDQVRQSFAEKEPVAERPVGEQDVVQVEYIPGEESDETQESRKTDIDLSEGNVREEFREALIGKNVGDAATVEISLEDPEDPEKPAETVRYDLKILSIMEKRLPEPGPELYSKVFGEEVGTEEAFRQKVREALEARFESESLENSKEEAVAKLCDASSVEVPEKLIERQMESIKKDEEQRIQQQTGKSREEYFKDIGINEEEHEKELRQHAENLVKRSLVLESFADMEKIQVEQQDLQQEIQELAQSVGVEAEKVQQMLANDKDRLGQLFGKIRYRKTVDRLFESVQVTDKEISEESEETEDIKRDDGESES
ncbi:MAG: trigger factor [Thermovirgaceae bacterium]